MMERLTRFWRALRSPHTLPVLERFEAYIRSLSPGDRVIASVLGLFVVATSTLSVYALERSLLIAVPAYGGSLTEGMVGVPRFVNPLLALSDSDRDLVALTYAGLMGTDGKGSLVPILAENYTASADGKVYTFKLRSNARFSDGTQVTADDVVFTVNKAQDPGLKSPEFANWSNIRAEAIDARTVRFTLPKPYGPFLRDTTLGILPSRLWKNVSDEEFPFSSLDSVPIGAGPFMVANVARNKTGAVDAYDLSASHQYALGRPYLDSIHFVFYGAQTDLQDAYRRGAIESAYGVTGARTLQAPYARIFGVFWNPQANPAFSHLEVRKALSIAIDRNQLVNGILGGYATALMGPVPPGSGIEEPPIPDPSTRIADAAKVLSDAGWTYDTDARTWKNVKDNLSLSITLKTSNVPELKTIAESLRQDWSELGVPVAIELYDPSDLTQNVIRPRAYDALLFGEVIGRDQDLFAFWDSSERNDPGLNIALYNNKAVDLLLEKARAENDPKTLHDDLQKISDLISNDYPTAFTHAPDFLYTIPKDLQGVELTQIASPSDRFASVAGWYRATELVWPFLVKSP